MLHGSLAFWHLLVCFRFVNFTNPIIGLLVESSFLQSLARSIVNVSFQLMNINASITKSINIGKQTRSNKSNAFLNISVMKKVF